MNGCGRQSPAFPAPAQPGRPARAMATEEIIEPYARTGRRPRLGQALLLAIIASVPLQANAASFPCARAKSPIETAICADPVLSKLDSDLASVFRTAMRGGARDGLLESQRQWLVDRTRICKTSGPLAAPCLIDTYRQRIAELTKRQVDAATKDTCRRTASMLRHGIEAGRLSATQVPPFVAGRSGPIPTTLKSALYRHLGEPPGSERYLELGELVDIGQPSDLVVINATEGGTLQCEGLTLFHRPSGAGFSELQTPGDDKHAANFGCEVASFGRDASNRPTVLVTSGNAAELSMQFSPWLGSDWGGSCRVRATYKVEVKPENMSCSRGIDCQTLGNDALAGRRPGMTWDSTTTPRGRSAACRRRAAPALPTRPTRCHPSTTLRKRHSTSSKS